MEKHGVTLDEGEGDSDMAGNDDRGAFNNVFYQDEQMDDMTDEDGMLTEEPNDLMEEEEVIAMVQEPKPRKTAPVKPQYGNHRKASA